MKVLLAGAFGHLGVDILLNLISEGYEVIACDLKEKKISSLEGKYQFIAIDATKPNTMLGICEGCDIVITTMGLVGKSSSLTNYDIDLAGNEVLLNEAKKAGVKRFVYVSVIHADSDSSVPMLDAKARFEEKLKESGMDYTIIRPTGYFYDIAHVFMPMVSKGKVTLLGKKDYPVNVIDTLDLAKFIVTHLNDTTNEVYEIGGKETYTYKEIAEIFFSAAKKKCKISRVPVFLFDLIIKRSRKKNDGSEAIVRFSKWTLTHPMEGSIKYGDSSFKKFVEDLYGGEKK